MARYIDADKLIEILKEIQQVPSPNLTKTTNEAIDLGLSLAMRMARKAPTADVAEVVHGEWSLHPDGSGTCNRCGRTQKSVWDFDNVQSYCGKCGAKMDGERKDT